MCDDQPFRAFNLSGRLMFIRLKFLQMASKGTGGVFAKDNFKNLRNGLTKNNPGWHLSTPVFYLSFNSARASSTDIVSKTDLTTPFRYELDDCELMTSA